MEWLADLPAHAVLDVCRQLDAALRNTVQHRKAGRDWGFPKRKKKFVNEPGIYMVGQATKFGDGWVRLPKLGRIKVSGGKLPEGKLIAARVWRDGGDRWMISGQFRCARPTPLPASNRTVAVDLGVRRLATIFDGQDFAHIDAPRPLRKAAKRLRKAQRQQSRRRKGSARRRVAARRVAVLHRKVREARKDFLHQLSHRLTAKAGVVKVEDLNVRGIARGFLAKSAADAGLGTLLRFIGYKADWRGRRIEKVGRFFPSSQLCSQCHRIHPEMKDLSRRVLRCPCGLVMDRDENAARNIFYRQEGGNGVDPRSDPGGAVRVEAGCQECAPVMADEARNLASRHEYDHESQ
jgi:putative transposase